MCAPAITILDGGMGHLLKERGAAVAGLPFEQQFLGSTLLCEAAPEVVAAAHLEYLHSGADVITTNNFVATEFSLAKLGRQGDVVALAQVRRRRAWLPGRLAREQSKAGLAAVLSGAPRPVPAGRRCSRQGRHKRAAGAHRRQPAAAAGEVGRRARSCTGCSRSGCPGCRPGQPP
jgi:hypothetical protein